MALERRFVRICTARRASARTTTSSPPSQRRVTPCVRARVSMLAAARRVSVATAIGCGSMSSRPASARARSCRSSMRWARCIVSSCSDAIRSGVGDVRPSCIDSSSQRMLVSGARSSCATSLTMRRRNSSLLSSVAAMALKPRASSSSSAPPAGLTRTARSPDSMRRAAAVRRSTGTLMARAMATAMRIPKSVAPRKVQKNERSSERIGGSPASLLLGVGRTKIVPATPPFASRTIIWGPRINSRVLPACVLRSIVSVPSDETSRLALRKAAFDEATSRRRLSKRRTSAPADRASCSIAGWTPDHER